MFFHDKFLLYKFRKTTVIDVAFYFSTYLYLSLLSPYMSTLGFSESLKGLFFAAFGLVGIFAAPIIGSLSDKVGRFRMIIAGIVLEAITLTGYILVADPVSLFIFRIIGAVGFNAVTLSTLARVQDTIEDGKHRNRITGLFHSMNSVAIMLAPPLGALIADEMGYQEVFMVSFCIMLLLLVALFFYDLFKHNDNYFHRPRGKLIYRDANPIAQVKDFLNDPDLRTAGLLGLFTNLTSPFVTLILPFILIEQLGLTNFHLGVVLFVFGFVHTFQYFFGILSERIGDRASIIIGVSTLALSFILFFLTKNYFVMLGIVFFRSIGMSLWNVAMWSHLSDIGEKKNIEGKVVGGYISLVRIATTISFIVSGALLVAWGTNILLFYAGIVIVGLLMNYKYVGRLSVSL